MPRPPRAQGAGPPFQGRFKSALVENWERLALLCRYIHLNLVRAWICDVRGLSSAPHSSYWNLRRTKTRAPFRRIERFLDGAGGLPTTTTTYD